MKSGPQLLGGYSGSPFVSLHRPAGQPVQRRRGARRQGAAARAVALRASVANTSRSSRDASVPSVPWGRSAVSPCRCCRSGPGRYIIPVGAVGSIACDMCAAGLHRRAQPSPPTNPGHWFHGAGHSTRHSNLSMRGTIGGLATRERRQYCARVCTRAAKKPVERPSGSPRRAWRAQVEDAMMCRIEQQ